MTKFLLFEVVVVAIFVSWLYHNRPKIQPYRPGSITNEAITAPQNDSNVNTDECADRTQCYCAMDHVPCDTWKIGDGIKACVNGECTCLKYVTCAEVEADEKKEQESSAINALAPTEPSYSHQDVITAIQETYATEERINERMGVKMKVTSKQLVALAKCESTWSPKEISPNGKYFGLYQWRPQDIPGGAQCALDISCSTIATIDAINNGETWRWPTCWTKSV